MPLLVRNITLGLDEPEERLLEAVARRLKVPVGAIRAYAPVRRSLDARKRDDVHFVYHLEVALEETAEQERSRAERLHSQHVTVLESEGYDEPAPGQTPLIERPVVVGFGPAGIFAALRLAQFGYRPIVLERGRDVRRRHRDILQRFYRDGVFNPESNLLYGEGGAGTYSDGKLYTRINDPLVRTVLEWFYHHGADPDVLTDARPHVGSDRLPTICRRMREDIERRGGEVRFESHLDDVAIDDGRVTHITVNGKQLSVGPVILATGHSARDTAAMLHGHGVRIEARPFQMGVRIEHPQSLVDTWQYGLMAGHDKLPPAEYHVVAKNAGGAQRDCYSFCMCPGGMILPTNESAGLVATNGASKSSRGGPFANCGLVISLAPPGGDVDPLVGIEEQRKWESKAFAATGGSYRVPCQRATDFLSRRPSDGRLETSYPLGGQWCDIRQVIPGEVAEALENALRMLRGRMRGFAGPQAVIREPFQALSETRLSYHDG